MTETVIANLSDINWAILGTLTVTGDATGASSTGTLALTIASNVVGNTKLAQAPADTFKGNPTGSTGNVTDMTGAQATGLLSVFVASGTNHAKGLVPDPGASSGSTKFLREDATFAVPSGTGITSVTGGTGITASTVSNATTVSLTNPVTVALGGTGLATLTAHGLLTGAGTANVSVGAAGTAGQVWTSNGASADGTYQGVPYDMEVPVFAETAVVTTGSNIVKFRATRAFTISAVRASLSTAGSSATIVDIKIAGTSIFTTSLLQIDTSATTSVGSGSPYNLTTTTVADNAEIEISVTTAGTSAAGLKVQIIGKVPS